MKMKGLVLGVVLSAAFCLIAYADSVPLKIGSTGEDVKTVQEQLINSEYLSDIADGIFGKKTEAAVKAFQKDKKLKATGVVDEQTLDLLVNNDENANSDQSETEKAGEYNDSTNDEEKVKTESVTLPDEVYNAVKERWYTEAHSDDAGGRDAKFSRTKLTYYERGSHKVSEEYNLISVEKVKDGFYENQYKLTYYFDNSYRGVFFFISQVDKPIGEGFDFLEDCFGDGNESYSGGASLYPKELFDYVS